jgi:hypothetical protein
MLPLGLVFLLFRASPLAGAVGVVGVLAGGLYFFVPSARGQGSRMARVVRDVEASEGRYGWAVGPALFFMATSTLGFQGWAVAQGLSKADRLEMGSRWNLVCTAAFGAWFVGCTLWRWRREPSGDVGTAD